MAMEEHGRRSGEDDLYSRLVNASKSTNTDRQGDEQTKRPGKDRKKSI